MLPYFVLHSSAPIRQGVESHHHCYDNNNNNDNIQEHEGDEVQMKICNNCHVGKKKSITSADLWRETWSDTHPLTDPRGPVLVVLVVLPHHSRLLPTAGT